MHKSEHTAQGLDAFQEFKDLGRIVLGGSHLNSHKKLFNGAEDRSGRMDKDVFAVGMVVTVRHGTGDNNAQRIEYRDNLRGPIAGIASGADNIIEVLGQTVVVENAAIFPSLKRNDIVEVSGFADNAGRIRAAYILPMAPPMPPPFREFEVKGFVSGLSGATFRLGPLPDGQGATVEVSYSPAAVSGLPGGPVNEMYVQVVTTDPVPDNGVIAAVRISRVAARTEFPNGPSVELEGWVTMAWSGSGKVLSFAVEGKQIRTNNATDFTGHSPVEIQPNARLLVQGTETATETGRVLSAVRIVFPQ